MGEQGRVNSASVLIVDDEPANLTVLTMMLEAEYRVQAARSGAKALTLMRGTRPPDLVLLDVMMPEMDGYQVLAAMHQDPLLKDIPVIFVTALDDDIHQLQGLGQGAVDYIPKPVKLPLLRARMRTQLALAAAKHRLEEEVDARTRELAEANHRLKQTFLETVRSFSLMLERRDPSLVGHSRRVAESARRIAQEMGCAAADTEAVVFAGLLSRIGAIGLPDRLLTRPWLALSLDERHTLIVATVGARDLIRKLPSLEFASQIIAAQFERYDGRGYPARLKGPAIPLGARILAVARDFDLLREGMFEPHTYTTQEAREYLYKRAGAGYDPQVVQVHNVLAAPNRQEHARSTLEVGLVDLVEGMDLAEVRIGDRVYLRDMPVTKGIIADLQQVLRESGEHATIKVRPRG